MKRLLLAMVLIAALGSYTEGRSQTAMDTAADSDMVSLQTWKDFDNWRKKYAPRC